MPLEFKYSAKIKQESQKESKEFLIRWLLNDRHKANWTYQHVKLPTWSCARRWAKGLEHLYSLIRHEVTDRSGSFGQRTAQNYENSIKNGREGRINMRLVHLQVAHETILMRNNGGAPAMPSFPHKIGTPNHVSPRPSPLCSRITYSISSRADNLAVSY